jgi:hypothetical protein
MTLYFLSLQHEMYVLTHWPLYPQLKACSSYWKAAWQEPRSSLAISLSGKLTIFSEDQIRSLFKIINFFEFFLTAKFPFFLILTQFLHSCILNFEHYVYQKKLVATYKRNAP